MKTAFLKGLLGENATKEAIDEILAENGRDIEAEKGRTSVLQAQLDTANETIKTHETQLEQLKNSPDNPETLKTTITTLQTQNQTDKETYETQLAEMKKGIAVSKALLNAKAKNDTAVKALLADYLKDAKVEEKNGDYTINGLDKQLENLQKAETSSFLFDVDSKQKDPAFNGLKPGDPGYKPNTPETKPKDQWTYDDFVKAEETNQ